MTPEVCVNVILSYLEWHSLHDMTRAFVSNGPGRLLK